MPRVSRSATRPNLHGSPRSLWLDLRNICKDTEAIQKLENFSSPQTRFGEHVAELSKHIAPDPNTWACVKAEPSFMKLLSGNGTKCTSSPICDRMGFLEFEDDIVGIIKSFKEVSILGLSDIPKIGILEGVISSFGSSDQRYRFSEMILETPSCTPPVIRVSDIAEAGVVTEPRRLTTFMLDPKILEAFTAALYKDRQGGRAGKNTKSIDDIKKQVGRLAQPWAITNRAVVEEALRPRKIRVS